LTSKRRSGYSFGDSARASSRLALLARVFAEPSRAFLAEAGLPGCGPGLRLFSLNLAQLREQGAVCDQMDRAGLDALTEELSALRRDGGPPITWGLRQLALEA
jgi:hypothetical protein